MDEKNWTARLRRVKRTKDIDGKDLRSQNADIHISGAGNATVWVEEELDANISGAGSVDYFGKPEVSKNVSGVGSVNGRGDK